MKVTEKESARSLRQQGRSVKEIARMLNVARSTVSSRSTVSLWGRDIQLTSEQIEELDRRVAVSREQFAYRSRCGGANQNKEQAQIRQERFRRAGRKRAA